MRLHFIVLLAAVLFIVIDGHPLLKSEEEEDEDSAPTDVNDEDQDEGGEKKTTIAYNEGTQKDETGEESNDATTERKAADITSDEVHQFEEDDDDTSDGVTRKDDVRPGGKAQVKNEEKVDMEEAKDEKHVSDVKAKKRHEKTEKSVEKKSTAKKAENNSKKWWMVGDSPHWGGRGHGHWGPPHHAENEHGGHGDDGEGHGGSHHKSRIPHCCKSKAKNIRKRCECAHHEEEADPHHLHGYHFHEHGHGGHNDHDHDLKGPWAFGYDGFGDDWNDWDHNHGNFEHLQKLDHDSHEKNHDHVGYHGDEGEHGGEHDCGKRGCIELPTETLAGTHLQTEQVGPSVVTQAAGPVGVPVVGSVVASDAAPAIGAGVVPTIGTGVVPAFGTGVAPAIGTGVVPVVGPGAAAPVIESEAAPIVGAGAEPLIEADSSQVMAAPASPLAVPPLPLVPLPVPGGHHLPYRLCHDCHVLKDGGSRCLCKAVKHGAHHASTNYDHHVYIDCDSAVHNYPYGNHLCYPRAAIPTPQTEIQSGGKAKQGVVYPYVGYGPWSAYPWWGDWWGGHGNHGWGGQNAACEHPCEHEKHGCECHHHSEHGAHEVDVDHGEALVHHEHPQGTHHGMATDSGHEIGFSLGQHGGPQLHAYRCHDIIENKVEDPATKAKRFCVPVGYHGGYGWPYWHGYPGVGTGLYGWGWPWIKNKVPGSKLKSGDNKTTTAGTKEASKTIGRRSYIDEGANRSNITKKQTIHVGYGYASGDNYRLGYGYGGMGGVAGFAPGASAVSEGGAQGPFSRSKIETDDDPLPFTKSKIPTPEKEITVTGTKRDIEKVGYNLSTSNKNG